MIDKLIENIKKKQAPVMVGLDPTMKLVPEHIKQKAFGCIRLQQGDCGCSA